MCVYSDINQKKGKWDESLNYKVYRDRWIILNFKFKKKKKKNLKSCNLNKGRAGTSSFFFFFFFFLGKKK